MRFQWLIVLCAVLMPQQVFAELAEKERELLRQYRDEFLRLTPGQDDFPADFAMGSKDSPVSRPVRKVRVENPFWIARYETTQEMYRLVMGENPSRWKGPRNSVEMVSASEAETFCRKVTQLLRDANHIAADEIVRLPTEVQWEYAARAGTTTAYSFGDRAEQLPRYGWFRGNAAGNDPPVGALAPNDWGLYDVHGYLHEWCRDAWKPSLAGDAQADADFCVVRGGSWKSPAEECTSHARRKTACKTRDDAIGFRCVIEKVR